MLWWRRSGVLALLLLALLLLLCVASVSAARTVRAVARETEGSSSAGGEELSTEVAAEEENEAMYRYDMLLLMAIITGMVFIMYFMHEVRYLSKLPETAGLVLYGVALGALIWYTGHELSSLITFNAEIFFLVILPPIIFDAGFSLQKEYFFAQIGGIILFAFVGTAISTVVVGCFLYLVGFMGWSYPLTMLDSLMYGALISAVDPVATLAIFQALKVNPQLHMLVFGESVVNDAVAIVIYRTLEEFTKPGAELGAIAILEATGEFVLINLGSVSIGIAFALVGALMFKHTNLRHHPVIELALMFVLAFAPYLLCDGLALSGIMAVLFNGIIMSAYVTPNLSPEARQASQLLFRTLAVLTESYVFVYLGMSLFTFPIVVEVPLWIWSLVLCLIGRAFNIFPLAYLLNCCRRTKIARKNTIIMWFSGLRGAIAFSLSVSFASEASRPVIMTTTLVMVLVTVVVMGGSTAPLLNCLKIERAPIENKEAKAKAKALDARRTPVIKEPHTSAFEKLNDRFLTPFFAIPDEGTHAELAARTFTDSDVELSALKPEDDGDQADRESA